MPCVGCGQDGKGRLCIRCVMKRRDWRQKAALTMRVSGMRYAQIGHNLGVGVERARQLVFGAQRNMFRVFVDGHLIGDSLARKARGNVPPQTKTGARFAAANRRRQTQ